MSLNKFLPQGTTVQRKTAYSQNNMGKEVYLVVHGYDLENELILGANQSTGKAMKIKVDSGATTVKAGNKPPPKFLDFVAETGRISQLIDLGMDYEDIKKSTKHGRLTEPGGVIKFDDVRMATDVPAPKDKEEARVYVARWGRPISRFPGDRLVISKGLLLLRQPKFYDEASKKNVEGKDILKLLETRGERLVDIASKINYEGLVAFPKNAARCDSMDSFQENFLAFFESLQERVANEAPAVYIRFFEASGEPIRQVFTTTNGNIPTEQDKLDAEGRVIVDNQGLPIKQRVRRSPESVLSRFMASPIIGLEGETYLNPNATGEDDKFIPNAVLLENIFESGGFAEILPALSVRLSPKMVSNMAEDEEKDPADRKTRFLSDIAFFDKPTAGVEVDKVIDKETGEYKPVVSSRFAVINFTGSAMYPTTADSKTILLAEAFSGKKHRIVEPWEINTANVNNYEQPEQAEQPSAGQNHASAPEDDDLLTSFSTGPASGSTASTAEARF